MKGRSSRKLATLLLVIGNIFVAQAHATYACTGTIDSLNVSPNGVVVLSSASSGLLAVYLCEIGSTTTFTPDPIGSEQCKAILSVLLTAQVAEKPVSFSFNDSLTCSTHPAWSWLTGWYFGPQMGN